MSKKGTLYAALSVFLCAFGTQKSTAQMVGGEVFLQGKHVEVGVAANGCFGSENAAPTGYHGRALSFVSHVSSTSVGFVADPDKDGWGSGTPAYYGDYFLPAQPFQAWAIEIAGSKYAVDRATHAGTSFPSAVSGSLTSYFTAGSTKHAIWQGNIGDLNITKDIYLDTNKLYFVVNIKLKNAGSVNMPGVYYSQAVNADNDYGSSSTLATRDSIIFQNPNTGNRALAISRGTVSGNYLGLGTKDCRAKVFRFTGSWSPYDATQPSLMRVYEGLPAYTTNFNYSLGGPGSVSNEATGVIFSLDTIRAGDSASFSYAYILKQEDLDSAFLQAKPNWGYNGSVYHSGDTLRPCSGSTLNLAINNGSAYSWTWTPATGLAATTGQSNTITSGTGIVTYRAVGTSISTSCGTSYDTLYLTVAPRSVPTAPTVTASVSYCRTATAVPLTAAKASVSDTLYWYTSATGGTKSLTAPTPATATAGTTTYYVSAKNTSGCEGPRAAISVTVNALPVAPTVSTPVSYCEGGTASALTATKTSGSDTLLWYTVASGGTAGIIAPTPATATPTLITYYVSQKNSLGCEGPRASILVRINPKPASVTVTPSGSTTFCNGDSVILNGTSAIPGFTGVTPFLNAPAASGTTSSCDCPNGYVAVGYQGRTGSWMDQFQLMCKPLDRFGILGSATSYTAANGSSGGGSYNGPYSFTGSTVMVGAKVGSNNTYINDITAYGQTISYITSLGDNTASATTLGTLGGGSPFTNLGTVWAPDGHVITGMYSYPTFYSGGVAFKYTPIGAFRYSNSWSTADTNASITVKTSGTYTFTVTNIFGCSASASPVTVTVNTLPTAPGVTTPVVYCVGATATALTATGTNLKWYTTATGGTGSTTAPIPSTTTAGTTVYYVSQSVSATGCEGPRSAITVTVNPLPAAPTATTSYIYCQNATATALTATGTNLKWYTVATGGTGSTTAITPSTATPGTTVYYVSQTISTTGCEGPRTAITVDVNPTPTAPTVTTPVTYCQNDVPAALSATGTSLKWYTVATGGTASTTTPTPSTTTAGTFTWYVSQTNGFSCESPRASISVTVNPTPAAPGVVSPQNICIGTTPVALTASGTNLKWYAAASGGTGSTSAPVPATTSLGSTNYYVSQTSSLGCESPRSLITVNIRPLPVVTINSGSPYGFVFCRNQTLTLKAVSATATGYQWRFGTPDITGAIADTIKADKTGTWGVTVSDVYGCKAKADVFVQEDTSKKPVLSPTSVYICEEGSALLTCNPGYIGYKFVWIKDGLTISSAPHKEHLRNVNLTGTYNVIVTNTFGCIDTTGNTNVYYYPRPVKPLILNLDPVLEIPAIYRHYQWYRDGEKVIWANSSNHTATTSGKYYVMVTDSNGCINYSDTVTIEQSTGIDVPHSVAKIKLYPNPTTGTVIIEAPKNVFVRITDLLGKVIYEGQNAGEIDLRHVPDAPYFVRLIDQYGHLLGVEKLIKRTDN